MQNKSSLSYKFSPKYWLKYLVQYYVGGIVGKDALSYITGRRLNLYKPPGGQFVNIY